MIFIEHTSESPYINFAMEEYFMNEKDLGDNHIFMFWRTTPTLMIGRFQNTAEEINTSFAKDNDIRIVRRNSGGGTIYTDYGAYQFSFIVKDTRGGETSFRYFTEPVIEALRKTGINAEFSSRNDLLVNGKKFSGNAQFKRKSSMTHHGSILFDTDLEMLVRGITVSDEKIISKGIKSVRERVTNLRQHMENPMNGEEFKNFMIDNIMRGEKKNYVPDVEDMKRITHIADEKFSTWKWNYGNNPKFDIEHKKRVPAGLIELKFSVKNGLIEKAGIFGDFFEAGDIENLERELIGIPYDKESITKAVYDKKLHENFYGVEPEEFVEIIGGSFV